MEENFITGEERGKLQALLAEDEELLWCGKPSVRFFSFGSIFMMLLGAAFFIAPVWMAYIICTHAQWQTSVIFCLFLSLFALNGLYLMFGLPVREYRARCRWLYALTNRRAIIVQNGETHEFPLAPYMVERLRAPQGKLGSIVFRSETVSRGRSHRVVELGFLDTPEAPIVLELLSRLLDGKVSRADKPMGEGAKRGSYLCLIIAGVCAASVLTWVYYIVQLRSWSSMIHSLMIPVIPSIIFYASLKTYFEVRSRLNRSTHRE